MRIATILVIFLIVNLGYISAANPQQQLILSSSQDALELIQSAGSGNLGKVKELISKDINVDLKSSDGVTALMISSQNGHLSIVSTLIANGAEVNSKAKGGWSALSYASFNGHADIVKILVENGADVNVRLDDGRTPLMLATIGGNSQAVSVLFQKNPDVNAKDKGGATAIAFAAYLNNADIVKILLDKGAEDIKNNAGWTALMIAKERNYSRITSLLEQHTLQRSASIISAKGNDIVLIGEIYGIMPGIDDGKLNELYITLKENMKSVLKISTSDAVKFGLIDDVIAKHGLTGQSIDGYGRISGKGINGYGRKVRLECINKGSIEKPDYYITSLEWIK